MTQSVKQVNATFCIAQRRLDDVKCCRFGRFYFEKFIDIQPVCICQQIKKLKSGKVTRFQNMSYIVFPTWWFLQNTENVPTSRQPRTEIEGLDSSKVKDTQQLCSYMTHDW